MSENTILPNDPVNYLLLDRFNRGVNLEINGTAPGWIKNAANWGVYDAGDGTGSWTTDSDGTGLMNVSGKPGNQDLMGIELGGAYNNIWIECLLGSVESLTIFMHSVAEIRSGAAHNSFQIKLSDDATNIVTTGRKTLAGVSVLQADDGTDDGDGTSDIIATTLLSGDRIKLLMSHDSGVYTIKLGDFKRSWDMGNTVPITTHCGITFTPNTANCHIYDMRVW